MVIIKLIELIFFALKHYLWENIKITPTYFESYLQAQLSF